MTRSAHRPRAAFAAAALLALALATATHAQSVAFSGMLGDKALLIIDGHARGVAVGSTVDGVRLVRIDGAQVQIDARGKTQTLRLGGQAVVAGDTGAAGGSRIVLPVGSGGHYTGTGAINGHAMQFMVDTGATSVAIGASAASEFGLDFRDSTATATLTANGAVAARRITLNSVRVGDVTVYNVDAIVVPNAMPVVLLGNSFLSHFQLHSDSSSLILDKTN